jgi:hypothetical protein
LNSIIPREINILFFEYFFNWYKQGNRREKTGYIYCYIALDCLHLEECNHCSIVYACFAKLLAKSVKCNYMHVMLITRTCQRAHNYACSVMINRFNYSIMTITCTQFIFGINITIPNIWTRFAIGFLKQSAFIFVLLQDFYTLLSFIVIIDQSQSSIDSYIQDVLWTSDDPILI